MGHFYLRIKFQNFLWGGGGGVACPHIQRLGVWCSLFGGPQKLPTPTFQFPTSTFHLFKTPTFSRNTFVCHRCVYLLDLLLETLSQMVFDVY